MTAAEHLRAWFTPERRELISLRAVDLAANRPLGTLARFLNSGQYMTFEKIDVSVYYPPLGLLGYMPQLAAAK